MDYLVNMNNTTHEVTIVKESLIDWAVVRDTKHLGWITKISIGYDLILDNKRYFFPKFQEAKAFAKKHA